MQTQREERASHQKRESEYLQRITKLKQLVTERSGEVRASEIIAEEANADSKWLLARGVPLIADRIVKSEELAKYMFELGEAAYDNGRKDGYGEGRSAVEAKEALKNFDLYKIDCAARYAEKRQEYEFLEFAIVKAVGKLSRKPDGVELLKKALGDEDREAGGVGLVIKTEDFWLACRVLTLWSCNHPTIPLNNLLVFHAREQFTFCCYVCWHFDTLGIYMFTMGC
ncbi:hypothetical protein Hanom_Chr16g01470351 [Helianthus anomalus]